MMAPNELSRIWSQVQLGEDSNLKLKSVEFRGDKVHAPRKDPLADELAAFGNGRGGWLVLGVTDDRQPQSLSSKQLDLLVGHIRDICTDSVKPPLDFAVRRILAPEPAGGGALVVEIPESAAVHRSPGGYFRRRGDAKRQMEPAEMRRLLHSRGQSDVASTDAQAVHGTGINSLEPDLWRRYASSRANEAAQAALSKLKFVKTDPNDVVRATVAGILLACADPRKWLPNAWIQAACYRSNRQLGGCKIGGNLAS